MIGGALRGTSVLERIGDIARRNRVGAHVVTVDPHPPGAGAIWRTDQSRLLLMNTPASASTMWPDGCEHGVSFWEWVEHAAQLMRDTAARQPPQHRTELIDAATIHALTTDPALHAAVAAATPESFLPRALHGHYLRWAHRRIVADLPPQITHRWVKDRVVDIRPSGSGLALTLAGGAGSVYAHGVVIATGWSDSAKPARSSSARTRRIDAGSPLRQDLTSIEAGEHVLAVGLGLGFFDAITLLTAGRGGSFREAGDGELAYCASGEEPIVVATSRGGFPYRSRVRGGLVGRAAEHEALKSFALPRYPGSIDFDTDLLPLIMRDAAAAYHEALIAQQPDAARDPSNLFDGASLLESPQRKWNSPSDLRRTVRTALQDDIDEACATVESPHRIAVRSFCDARRLLVPLVRYGGLAANASRESYRHYVDRVSWLSNGPPLRRIRELKALLDAGVVDFLGPAPYEYTDPATGQLVAASADVVGSARRFSVRLDARSPKPSIHSTDDELISALRASGMVRPWRPTPHQTTDAVDTEQDSGAVLGGDGAAVHGLYAAGLLTWDYRVHSLMAPVPGNRSLFFEETARVAEHVLETTGAPRRPVHINHHRNGEQSMPNEQSERVVTNTAQLITPQAAEERLASGAIFIDVRRRGDDPVPAVNGAVVVNKQHAAEVLDPSSPQLLAELADGLESEIVVFCNSEFGSDPVVGKLNELGYTRVSHIKGGYRAWLPQA